MASTLSRMQGGRLGLLHMRLVSRIVGSPTTRSLPDITPLMRNIYTFRVVPVRDLWPQCGTLKLSTVHAPYKLPWFGDVHIKLLSLLIIIPCHRRIFVWVRCFGEQVLRGKVRVNVRKNVVFIRDGCWYMATGRGTEGAELRETLVAEWVLRVGSLIRGGRFETKRSVWYSSSQQNCQLYVLNLNHCALRRSPSKGRVWCAQFDEISQDKMMSPYCCFDRKDTSMRTQKSPSIREERTQCGVTVWGATVSWDDTYKILSCSTLTDRTGILHEGVRGGRANVSPSSRITFWLRVNKNWPTLSTWFLFPTTCFLQDITLSPAPRPIARDFVADNNYARGFADGIFSTILLCVV